MNQEALWLSILFLVGEVFVLAATVGFSLSQVSPAVVPYRDLGHLPERPRVDVLVMRRWDSIEATRQTARAAQQMDYPRQRLFIHIIDLEDNAEIRALAKDACWGYVTCLGTTTDPLQSALEDPRISADLLLLLEPGQYPDPDLLKKMVPFFFKAASPEFNNVGYVQAMLQAVGHPTTDHPLQQLIPMGEMGGEAAPLLGTGALVRRQALTSLGYVDSRRPVRMGCQIHQQGWRSHLCRGTCVTGALLPLRNSRIALLAMLGALKQNPITSGKTTRVQRFQYLWLGFWSMSGLADLIYFWVPIWFLWVGSSPVLSFGRPFLVWFLPYVVVGRLAWLASFAPSQWWDAWRAERQTKAQFFQSVLAIVQSLQQKVPYRERPSQLSIGPQALLIGLTLSAIGIGCGRLWQGWQVDPLAFTFGLLWAAYNLICLSIRPPGFDIGFLLSDEDA